VNGLNNRWLVLIIITPNFKVLNSEFVIGALFEISAMEY
jgi:hypothetical protein